LSKALRKPAMWTSLGLLSPSKLMRAPKLEEVLEVEDDDGQFDDIEARMLRLSYKSERAASSNTMQLHR
jgi:hypothetical protein